MTAIRNFPNAPLARRAGKPLQAHLEELGHSVWQALQRAGQRRAAWELDHLADRKALTDPVLARLLRAAAEQCRRDAITPPERGARSAS